jgi:hypothetical protein
MIHERYYSYIKNYQRDDGAAFMNNVYNPTSFAEGITGELQEKQNIGLQKVIP